MFDSVLDGIFTILSYLVFPFEFVVDLLGYIFPFIKDLISSVQLLPDFLMPFYLISLFLTVSLVVIKFFKF